MKITLAENSKWGGWIPDILRNKRIKLKFGELVFEFKDNEYDQLISLLSKVSRDLFKDAEQIAKEYDRVCDITRDFYHKYENLFIEANWDISKNGMRNLIETFYDDFWKNEVKPR
jgi:hypothetical protein